MKKILLILALCVSVLWGDEAGVYWSNQVRMDGRSGVDGRIVTGTESISLLAEEKAEDISLQIDGSVQQTEDERQFPWNSGSVSDGWHHLVLMEGAKSYSQDMLSLNGSGTQLHGGVLTSSETWTANALHLVRHWVRIPAGMSLTISDGSIVKFCSGAGIQIDAGGELHASNVIFTQLADDTAGGDTDMNGSTYVPYDTYAIDGVGEKSLNNCELRYLSKVVMSNVWPYSLKQGEHAWFEQADISHDGTSAWQSAAIGDNESSTITTTVNGAGTLSFYWKVSSESGCDKLNCYVDGNLIATISGDVDWVQKTQQVTGSGVHTIKWEYAKNDSGMAGSDCSWLDQLNWNENSLEGNAEEWFAQSAVSHSGNAAWQSNDIDDGESTYMQGTVSGPGTLSFYWKVSCENTYDQLSFYVDEQLISSISGEQDWQQLNYYLEAGEHLLKWEYKKDGDGTELEDCGWVDEIGFIRDNRTFTVTVNGGSGSNAYVAGQTVSVVAEPATGQTFSCWDCTGMTLTETQKAEPSFTFAMPANDVTLTACCVPWEKPNWITPVDMANSMTCEAIVKLLADGEYVNASGSMLAFFDKSGACRGSATIRTNALGNKIYSVQLWSNETYEEGLTAKVWNAANGETLDVNGVFTFEQDTAMGSALEPVEMSAGCTTITWNVNTGWNWLSINVTPVDASVTTVLKDYQAVNGDQIKTKDGYSTYYAAYQVWDPEIDIEPGKMYAFKRNGSEAATVTISGIPLAADNTISLVAGWNWIGCFTNAESITVEDLRSTGGFSNKDQLKGKGSAYTTYYKTSNFEGWDGTLLAMEACKGYKFYTAQAGELSVEESATRNAAEEIVQTRGISSCPWTNPDEYANNMTLAMVVKNAAGQAQENTGSCVGVFDAQGNCRGVATLFTTKWNTKVYSGMAYSNQAAENGLTLKHWDAATGAITDINETLDFVNDGTFGNSMNPEELTLAGDQGYEAVINGVTEEYEVGDEVSAYAPAAPQEQKFQQWEAQGIELEDEDNPMLEFTMPAANVTLTAKYVDLDFFAPEGWYAASTQQSMLLVAEVKLPCGTFIDDDASMLACFDAEGNCRGTGVPDAYLSSLNGHSVYYMHINEGAQARGLTFRFWDEGTDEYIDIEQSVDFEAGQVLGEETPLTMDALYNLNDASNPESPYYCPEIFGEEIEGTVLSMIVSATWSNSSIGYDYKLRMHDSATAGYDDTYDVQMPPRIPPYLYDEYAYFKIAGAKLQVDTRPAAEEVTTWSMEVVVPSGKTASIGWDSSNVPEEWMGMVSVLDATGSVEAEYDALQANSLEIATEGTWNVQFSFSLKPTDETFTYKLKAGWNIITPTLYLNAASIRQLMSMTPMLYDFVQEDYVQASEDDLIPGMAIWLYCNDSMKLELAGTEVEEWQLGTVVPGWSFMGAVTDVPEDEVPDAVISIWSWTPSGYRQVKKMTAGAGYWIQGE